MNDITAAAQLCRQITDLYVGSKRDMVRIDCSAGAGETCLLPVVCASTVGRTLLVEDNAQSVYVLPRIIQDHREQLMGNHERSSVYNNTNIRVNEWSVEDGIFRIRTGRTTYFDTLVTNRAMDYEFGEGLSVRRLFEPGPIIHPLASSRLSNHLGINGFVETKDHYYCFVSRKQSVSYAQGLWGCGVSGSLKAKYCMKNGLVTEDGLVDGIVSEIRDELNLDERSFLRAEGEQAISLIFAYRDLLEGGKPHLLFHARCALKKEEVARLFREKNQVMAGNKGIDLSSEMSMDGHRLLWVSRYDIERPDRLHLYPDRFSIGGRDYFTAPSYAACIQMLRTYLRT